MLLLGLLYNLRSQGIRVGTGEWLTFLQGLDAGLAETLDGLYYLARAILVHDEANFDAYDVAFTATFKGVALPPLLKDALADWLAEARQMGTPGEAPPGFGSLEEMLEELKKRLAEQTERHDGGRYWVGTGGTSPFGNSGKNDQGIRIGGASQGGGAVQVAEERLWGEYRTDLTLGVRDFQVALATLRRFAREGEERLDIEETIGKTAKNGGEIDIAFSRDRINRVRLTLLMDVGGSMDPHTALVSRLFSAASELKIFKTFEALYFHNCPYGWLYRNYSTYDRKPTAEVLADLTPQHRVIFVGDASMAPWELLSSAGGFGDQGPSGIDWLKRFASKTPHVVWLNPDPERFWDHPTVRAIGQTFPMFPLTLSGLKDALRELRAPA